MLSLIHIYQREVARDGRELRQRLDAVERHFHRAQRVQIDLGHVDAAVDFKPRGYVGMDLAQFLSLIHI